MPTPLTWTFDVYEPEPEPENAAGPEPNPAPLTPERLDSPNSLASLMALLFDSFRDDPLVYRRLKDIVALWRDGPLPKSG